MPLGQFHPAVADWFASQFSTATEIQTRAWPAIQSGQATLIAAPTGSGKTLAAFMASIDQLICQGQQEHLPDQTFVLYVSPLKALSNDIQKNLQQPLNGIRDKLLELCLPDVNIRAWVRTGDTPARERQRMIRTPPHIIVTTPESLYILLTSDSGRNMLRSVKTVIVDEIHALVGNKRGAHLSLSLQRLELLCQRRLTRIGLSATQKPIQEVAKFLMGNVNDKCNIIDAGHHRDRDISLEVPESPLEAIMANEVWEEQYRRLVSLVEQHKTTLIFVNNRRLAERAAHNLAEQLGEENVTAHHGSLSREHRLDAEQRLKEGSLRALVATASLELGIDIGNIDLVCQIGSPRSISAFLQRVGRSGHSVGGTPKGRLFPLSRDDLVECSALLDAINREELDTLVIPTAPLDVIAQHIVAEVSAQEWPVQILFESLTLAWPYRDLSRQKFEKILIMLADGYSTRRGRRSAYIHYDRVNQIIRAKRGARLTAVMNSGAIPDLFDYDVILEPDGFTIGNLNEDFAFESLPGDIFQLGNTAYRILKIQQGKVFVQDAHGQPPTIPFWFGEAPGRSQELSAAVSRLRNTVIEKLHNGSDQVIAWLQSELNLPLSASQQLTEYLSLTKACFGTVPSTHHFIFERFFDETGDMHFIIHAPMGSRINRAWGLALRKRFCRKFNFELQAAATDDHIILSLGPTHSFPLAEVANYLKADTVHDILVQALLDAPIFATRWRWVCNIALAVPRMRSGKRVPAQFQRNDAEDLVAVIFPDQLACLENIVGNREIPDHPLVEQTLRDCLHENMDIEGLQNLLRDINSGITKISCFDLAAPSPMAAEILTAKPYAFLDDAPAEERRTLAIKQRRGYEPDTAALLSTIDPEAIKRVQQECWPDPRNADELHDALTMMGFISEQDISQNTSLHASWPDFLQVLQKDQRVTQVDIGNPNKLMVAAERLHEFIPIYGQDSYFPVIATISDIPDNADACLLEIIRGRLEAIGPCTANDFSRALNVSEQQINLALLGLEQEGFVVRGQFNQQHTEQWCERRLLARIHRYTLNERRKQYKPISAAEFMRFLFHWQHVDEPGESPEALLNTLHQLEGCNIPAQAWEQHVLSLRVKNYTPDWLDNLCITGRVSWLRLLSNKEQLKANQKRNSPIRSTPIVIMPRNSIANWISEPSNITTEILSDPLTLKILHLLQQRGALFFTDIVSQTGLLRSQVETALANLVSLGRVSSDHFTGLRALTTVSKKRPKFGGRLGNPRNIEEAGRWWLLPHANVNLAGVNNESQNTSSALAKEQHNDYIARCLLRRYGVVFRKLLDRENFAPPWRDLLYCYRRLEARGEIQGGRFVQGFSGEQFALSEAIPLLSKIKRQEPEQQLLSISAADPLNLTGIITPGERISVSLKSRIVYVDGKPMAALINNNLQYFHTPKESLIWAIQNHLFSHSINRLSTTPTPSQPRTSQ